METLTLCISNSNDITVVNVYDLIPEKYCFLKFERNESHEDKANKKQAKVNSSKVYIMKNSRKI